jgi:hypothetical protein
VLTNSAAREPSTATNEPNSRDRLQGRTLDSSQFRERARLDPSGELSPSDRFLRIQALEEELAKPGTGTRVHELKRAAEVTGGTIVVLSFKHGTEEQGRYLDATGIVVRDPSFDPKKVTRGHIPSEI